MNNAEIKLQEELKTIISILVYYLVKIDKPKGIDQ